MATERQIEASRANGRKGKGPTTAEGKDKVRGNSYKHGLTATVLAGSARAEVYEARRDAWFEEVAPEGDLASFALDRAAAASVRIEQCEDALDALAAETSSRASLVWAQDRRAEAAVLAESLRRRPRAVARRLEATYHGVEVLLEGWAALGEVAADRREWDDDQRSRALDLLGVAPEDRSGRTRLDPPEGIETAHHMLNIASDETLRLRRLKDGPLAAMDDVLRRQAEAGLMPALPKSLALLIRYQRESRTWFHKMLTLAGQPAAKPAAVNESKPPTPTPAPVARREPEPIAVARADEVTSWSDDEDFEPTPPPTRQTKLSGVPTHTPLGRKLNRRERRGLAAASRKRA